MKSFKAVFILLFLLILIYSCTFQTGLDVAAKDNFSILKGKKVGIVTNHTARSVKGEHIVDMIHESGITIHAIYAPEHGFRGDVERGVVIDSNIDSMTGAQIFSIYGNNRKPSPEMLTGIDVMIFDIQDIGSRFYTYISTLGMIMEAAAENGIPVYIFDRPNPIGRLAEGPVMQEEFVSFVGQYPIVLRHGMTVGELALMYKDKNFINAADDLELHVIEMKGWHPDKPYTKTKLPWIAPSPNIKNLNEALVYPGTCLFEGTNFSEGRGTEHPFEWVGAPYINSQKVIDELTKRNLNGIEMKVVTFTPEDIPGTAMDPKYKGELCQGLALAVTDPVHFRSLEFGVHLINVLQKLYPEDFLISRPDFLGNLWGNDTARIMFSEKKSAFEIIESYKEELNNFIGLRDKYILY
ncbi:MAG: DUF1343 domain-containing protein [Candidatus Marinimicrobia bacterium]|nr:DUF1343 domain-containing protein [Candidatus Neomarinimicrobiota bacterium]